MSNPSQPKQISLPDAIRQAVDFHRQGRLDDAERLYTAILQAQRNHFDALHLLGVLMHQRGRSADALTLIAKALQENAQSADAQANFGRVLAALNRHDEAIASYDRALALVPGHIEALFHRGNALVVRQRHAEALAAYDRVIALSSKHVQAHINRGVTLRALQRAAEAISSYDCALALKPDSADAFANRGNAFIDLGQLAEAVQSFDRSLALNACNGDAHYNRGNALMGLGRHAEALESYERALTLDPVSVRALLNRGAALRELQRLEDSLASYDRALVCEAGNVDALCGRGDMLRALGRAAEAVESYDRALMLDPDRATTHNNRGNALADLNRPADALASFERALMLKPGAIDMLLSRGNVLMDLRRIDEALASYDAVLAHDSKNADAHWNKSLIWLALGDFERGLPAFEWRMKRKDRSGVRSFDLPRWSGAESVEGKTILLHAEQGFGDTIQFIRYAPLVASRGATVIVEAPDALKPLIANIDGVSRVVSRNEPTPPFDLHCPLLSLPLAFGPARDSIPATVPYLQAPAEHLARWRQRLPDGMALRIGIAWSGNPSHKNDRNRSIALDRLATLLSDSRIVLVGLQRDIKESDLRALREHPNLVSLGSEFADFADTAAVVSMLDLVISVDTSVAHLAGAMGKPLWMLLPFSGDWRWMLEGEQSPWYPSARLFRQPVLGDWDSALVRVREALTDHLDDVAAELSSQSKAANQDFRNLS